MKAQWLWSWPPASHGLGEEAEGFWPLETVVAAVAGASARTLLSWISEKSLCCTFLLCYDAYGVLQFLDGLWITRSCVPDGIALLHFWAGTASLC